MVDWTASMQQTYEYYIVDPVSWKDVSLLNTVKTSSIARDSETDTLGSATLDITESVGECYVRIYLVTVQNGVKERHPLATVLVQTPSSTFTGNVRNVTMDAYTPLIELKEKQPPLGYSLRKKSGAILTEAYKLADEYARAPVVPPTVSTKDKVLPNDFVAEEDNTWLTFIKDLLANAGYKIDVDAMGYILFAPDQETDALQPVWTFDDSNSSILYPEITMNHDIYGIPNVVEVVYSRAESTPLYSRCINDDPNSPTSTVNRGREITIRVTDPELPGDVNEDGVIAYAKKLLKEYSTVEYTVTYIHGYCPVRVGDCVRLNYTRAGITDIKAKVISQNIKCTPGCPVTEKAVFTTKLWG